MNGKTWKYFVVEAKFVLKEAHFKNFQMDLRDILPTNFNPSRQLDQQGYWFPRSEFERYYQRARGQHAQVERRHLHWRGTRLFLLQHVHRAGYGWKLSHYFKTIGFIEHNCYLPLPNSPSPIIFTNSNWGWMGIFLVQSERKIVFRIAGITVQNLNTFFYNINSQTLLKHRNTVPTSSCYSPTFPPGRAIFKKIYPIFYLKLFFNLGSGWSSRGCEAACYRDDRWQEKLPHANWRPSCQNPWRGI